MEAGSFPGNYVLVYTALYLWRRKSWTNLEHRSENLESSLRLVFQTLSSQKSRAASLYWTFCICRTSLERSLITSSFLLPTLQSVCTHLIQLWVTLLEHSLQWLAKFGCHRVCVLRCCNIRVIVLSRKREDVVCDCVAGGNRRKVHCLVSVHGNKFVLPVESLTLGVATWYTSQHSGLPLWIYQASSRFSDTPRAGRSNGRIPVGARYFAPVQTGPRAHPASYTLGTGSFPGVKRPRRGVDHLPHLAPRLKEE